MSTPPAPATPAPLAESLEATRRRLAHHEDSSSGPDLPITTGFIGLDDALNGGLRPGEVAVIGARAGVGASTLARNLASNATRAGIPALLVSPADGHLINLALLAAVGRVPCAHLDRADLSADQWVKVDAAVTELSQWPLWVAPEVAATPASLAEAVARHEDADIRLLVVDGPSPVELADVRGLARSRDMAVVMVDRVNSPAARADRPPLLEDLRGVLDAVELADQVILIHRDEVANAESRRPGEADLMLCLNRRGPIRDVAVAFQGHYRRFVDLA